MQGNRVAATTLLRAADAEQLLQSHTSAMHARPHDQNLRGSQMLADVPKPRQKISRSMPNLEFAGPLITTGTIPTHLHGPYPVTYLSQKTSKEQYKNSQADPATKQVINT